MGEGDAFVASKTNNSSNPSSETSFFIEQIAKQAEEIGILKQTIVQHKQESAGRVSGCLLYTSEQTLFSVKVSLKFYRSNGKGCN